MATWADEQTPLAHGAQRSASGTVIAGKYRLETLLGRGGMGAVYAARHAVTGRRFAIKLLGRELCGDAGAEERFMREAMLASAIQHPAIVEVYDVGRDRGQPYMVMRLVEGETLSQRMRRGRLPACDAIALLLPVIDAVAAAHAAGVVHRDLKPDNVMIERDGDTEQPRVLDFGVSKLICEGARTRITNPGMLIGTPDYMAPEQVRGEANLDARTDIYALGVILYEMLTGKLPYDAEDCPELLRKILLGGAPGVRMHDPGLSPDLEAVVARAMASARELRHQDASELALDLSRCAAPFANDRFGDTAAGLRPADSLTPLVTTASLRALRPPPARLYAALALAVCGAALALGWRAWPWAWFARPHPAQAGAAELSDATKVSAAPPQPQPRPSLAVAAVAPTPRPVREPIARVRERGVHEPEARRARRARRLAAQLETGATVAAPIATPTSDEVPSVTSELLDPFD